MQPWKVERFSRRIFLAKNQVRRAAHVQTASRTEDWGNSVWDFFAQTFFHTIVSDAELLRS